MTPGEWTAIAGVVSGLAGAIWGYAFAWGRTKSKIDGHGELLSKIVRDFSECQKRGTECTASTKVLFEATSRRMAEMQVDFAAHKASVHSHHESQDVHTTSEWRKNVFDRLDKIQEGFDRKIEDQTRTLIGRIESVEKAVRNGGKS